MESEGRHVKAKQLAALQRMLSLTQQDRSGAEWGEQWKVLIYDRHGRDIITPLLDVAQLRKCGVTLHMFLDSEREAIPDVPAVYFCQPTPENVKRIAQDCSKKLYSSVHLNFISKLERRLMEDLARELIASDSVSTIAKVHDQFLDFVCLEPTLFSLNHTKSYAAYSGAGVTEAMIEQCMRRITEGLFSVFATLGSAPIIRAPQNGPSEMVARQLHERLRLSLAQDKFFDRGSVVTTRPLLIILDRALDFSTPLQHTCTYQALVDDVLDYKMNRVIIKDPDTGAKKPYDLEVEQDPFWRKYGPRLLPEAVDENHDEMNRIREKEKVIRAKTGQKQAEEGSTFASTEGGAAAEDHATQDLLATVDSLPQLLERKTKLEAHTMVMRAAMNVIEARELHKFHEAEHEEPPKMDEVSRLIGADSKGSLQDKLRLLAVLSMRPTEATAAIAGLEEALSTTHAGDPAELERGLQALKHIRQMQSFQHGSTLAESPAAAPGSGGVSGGGLTSWVQSKTAGIIGQVQSLLTKSQSNYVTRVVDNVCEMRPGTEDEAFIMLDAKRKDQTPMSQDPAQRSKAPFRDVYVFLIGGGCYAEYQALQEYSAGSPERHVTYGCTELTSPEKLLAQLGAIGV